jgi:two-component system CheB/CheR fusion protein
VEERTEELLRINHALEVSNHDLQQFASVASHDLQEPLRKIHLYANMVQERYSDTLGGAANYLQKVLQSSVRMKSIINNILSYSRLTIPGQIRHVFQNMIGNSLKFGRAGVAPEISIRGERVRKKDFDSQADEHGSFLKVTVQDNGIGFDEKFAQHVFVLFQRLHSKDTFEGIEGTGIGLAIVKKIIEKHNGLIKATGREGQGACFEFIIPLRQYSTI